MSYKQKILLVDNIPVNLVALESILKVLDVNIITASNGNDAIQKTLNTDFDLILMDVQMPEMDGFEAVEYIRREEKNRLIPILFQAGINIEVQNVIKGIQAGVVDYIAKPISEEILIGKVKLLLEMQRRRKELEKLNAQLQENNKQKTMFLAALSHEIRTPMNAILGSTHLLKKAKKRKEQNQYIDIIETSGNLLLAIINNVLDYSKLEAGKSTVIKNCFCLNKVSEELYPILTGIAKEKNLEFIIHPDVDLSIEIVGDDLRLKQVLLNLCNNAFKYTKKGSVTLKIEKISESKTIIKYKFSIIDTGIGISEENIQHLFKPFSQFSTKSNNAIEGTGLGLSIVKSTVELMGGEIGVKSIPDVSSTFWFELKFKKFFKKEKRALYNKRRAAYSRIKNNLRILITDDDKFSRIILEKILNDLGFNSIDIAENGRRAVDLVKTGDYGIILMDCMMPVMNGYEATVIIKKETEKNNKNIYIIALSADVLAESREACLSIGMDNFLLKPVNSRDLDNVIREIIVKEMGGNME